MPTLRKTPALSNNGGVKVNDDTYAEEVNANVVALWARNACWLNTVAGTNTITASADAPLTAVPTRPNSFILSPAGANTGAVTLNIDSTGALAVTDINGVALGSGALQTATIYLLIYDGTKYRCFNPTITSASVQVPTAIFADQKALNTAGGTFTSGAWQIRTLNTTIYNTIAGCSLATNQVTLPAGNFYLEWRAPAGGVGGNISRLFNVTGSTQVAQSESGQTPSGTNQNMYSVGFAKVAPSGATTYRVEHWGNTTNTTNGFGFSANVTATIEQYTTLRIWGPL
jgi:hypothetical protein